LNHPAVFLTYDDGPNPEITPRLLNLLRGVGAAASFFVTGESLDHTHAPALVRLALEGGHTIGNHGLLHVTDAYPEFEKMRKRLREAAGVDTALFRAPYGRRNLAGAYLERDPEVLAFHWTFHLEDWLPVDLEAKSRLISEVVQPGAIILLHDGALASSQYPQREHVLELTEMLLAECRRRAISVAGLAQVYPWLHRRHVE
jgi:peptidoglycan/xylan/chitin deacetylase (PgdA/CDA1 family)